MEDDKKENGKPSTSRDRKRSEDAIGSEEDKSESSEPRAMKKAQNLTLHKGKKDILKIKEGRIGKKRLGRGQGKTKAPRRKRQKKRIPSISTILSKQSLRSNSPCDYCGHRCCQRRYKIKRRRTYNRHKQHASHARRRRRKLKTKNKKISECIQTGSRSMMLSRLCIKTYASPASTAPRCQLYSDVSPEMIHMALKQLTMWRQDVPTEMLLEYIRRNYPVNQEKEALLEELLEKLRIATLIGMVSCKENNTWSLTHTFQRRGLTDTHVSLFWESYGDTMRPVTKMEKQQKPEEKKQQESNFVHIYEEYT